MYIIPAIDLIEGKCVRLTQGDFVQKKAYHDNPVEVAKSFEDQGIDRLHLVDLDGAKQKKVVNLKVLEQIATQTRLHIDFGGGVQSDQDIEQVFNAGATQVTGGSIAVKHPELFETWIDKYGADRIILGADVKGEYIAVSGWQETSQHYLYDFLAKYLQKGIKYVICTDVSKDGLLQGTSVGLYQQIKKQFPQIQLIASGGVGVWADVEALNPLGLFGVIVGKAIYEGNISLQQIGQHYGSLVKKTEI